jgi:hypothetical protein
MPKSLKNQKVNTRFLQNLIDERKKSFNSNETVDIITFA